jgi:N-acetyl-D-muramate 6-phosphate phosphatase
MIEEGVKPEALAVDAVLFDLDGTLADTAPDLGAALNRVRCDRGLGPVPLARLRPYASHGARGLIGAGMAVAPGEPAYEELRDAFLAHYAAALCVDSKLFADVDAVLDALDARVLPWGIVTNKATCYTTPLLTSLRLTQRAATVVCGDTMPFAKPHPAPLTEAASRLGVAPGRCVYVGDSRRDIEAGNAAGMHTLVARWGYIEAGDEPDTWRADGILDEPAALLGWLRS